MEEWKTIEGYDGRYEVSSHGRIRSVSMFLGNHIYHGKVLSPTIATNGYLKVNLILRGKKKTCLVHRLVAKAFIENRKNLPQVNHKDEIKTNNNVDNLECSNGWVNDIKSPNDCNGIDCGTNEELFLAIAALRDDTDDSQWFVYPPENTWFICDDDDINYARANIRDSVQAAWFHCSHKATVEELIEHFKEKE